MGRIFSAGLCIALALIFSGCGGHVAYDRLESLMRAGDCSQASAFIEQSREDYPDNARLLWLLDSAMVHMHCQQFDAAQDAFRQAEGLAQDLWTTSISRETASFLTNDYVLGYRGEDYEQAMIHMMSALSYVEAGEPDEALVECRRLDSLLTLFNDRYDHKNVYREDAFGRYLSGFLREGTGEPDGAFIDYKKAVEAYDDFSAQYGVGMPASLRQDLFRAAKKAGRLNDAKALFPDYRDPEDDREKGMVVWIRMTGRVPEKTEDRIMVPTTAGPVTIAFPRYEAPELPPPGETMTLTSQSGEVLHVQSDLASDLGAIAVKNLEDRRIRVAAKVVARAAAKQVVIHQATRNRDPDVEQALKVALNVVNAFVEHADTRSWLTLPGQIYIGRARLAPGAWEAEYRKSGTLTAEKVLVKAGQIHYIIINDIW